MINNTSLYKVLYTSTIIGRRMHERGKRIEGCELSDVYERPSDYKERAYNNYFLEFLADEDARLFRITSHNRYYFTLAWNTLCIDPKTGTVERCMLMNTGRNRYLVIDV